MSEENIENITKSDSNFAPTFVHYHLLPDMTFNGHCLTLFCGGQPSPYDGVRGGGGEVVR